MSLRRKQESSFGAFVDQHSSKSITVPSSSSNLRVNDSSPCYLDLTSMITRDAARMYAEQRERTSRAIDKAFAEVRRAVDETKADIVGEGRDRRRRNSSARDLVGARRAWSPGRAAKVGREKKDRPPWAEGFQGFEEGATTRPRRQGRSAVQAENGRAAKTAADLRGGPGAKKATSSGDTTKKEGSSRGEMPFCFPSSPPCSSPSASILLPGEDRLGCLHDNSCESRRVEVIDDAWAVRKLAEIRRRSRTIDATSLVNQVSSGKRDDAAEMSSRAEEQDGHDLVSPIDDRENDPLRRTPDGRIGGGVRSNASSEGTGTSPCGAGAARKEDAEAFRVAAEREVYPLVQSWEEEATDCTREAEGVRLHGDSGEVNPRAGGLDHHDPHLASNGPLTPLESALSLQGGSRETPRGCRPAVRTGQFGAVSPHEKIREESNEGTPRREALRGRAPRAEGEDDGKPGVRQRRDTTSEGDGAAGNLVAIESQSRACDGGEATEVTCRRKRRRAQEVAARGDQERRVRAERTASVLRVLARSRDIFQRNLERRRKRTESSLPAPTVPTSKEAAETFQKTPPPRRPSASCTDDGSRPAGFEHDRQEVQSRTSEERNVLGKTSSFEGDLLPDVPEVHDRKLRPAASSRGVSSALIGRRPSLRKHRGEDGGGEAPKKVTDCTSKARAAAEHTEAKAKADRSRRGRGSDTTNDSAAQCPPRAEGFTAFPGTRDGALEDGADGGADGGADVGSAPDSAARQVVGSSPRVSVAPEKAMTPAARRLRERRRRELERALEDNARMEGLMEEQRAKREMAMASFEARRRREKVERRHLELESKREREQLLKELEESARRSSELGAVGRAMARRRLRVAGREKTDGHEAISNQRAHRDVDASPRSERVDGRAGPEETSASANVDPLRSLPLPRPADPPKAKRVRRQRRPRRRLRSEGSQRVLRGGRALARCSSAPPVGHLSHVEDAAHVPEMAATVRRSGSDSIARITRVRRRRSSSSATVQRSWPSRAVLRRRTSAGETSRGRRNVRSERRSEGKLAARPGGSGLRRKQWKRAHDDVSHPKDDEPIPTQTTSGGLEEGVCPPGNRETLSGTGKCLSRQ